MARPKHHVKVGDPKYQYTGYDAVDPDTQRTSWIAPHIQCEEEGDHRVEPKTWPPVRPLNDPSLDQRCVLCGTNLQVYLGHATGELAGVTVAGEAVEKWRARQPKVKQPA